MAQPPHQGYGAYPQQGYAAYPQQTYGYYGQGATGYDYAAYQAWWQHYYQRTLEQSAWAQQAGYLKDRKPIDLLSTNIGNFGTAAETEIKKNAGATEASWTNAGKKPGLEIWRVEKFQVKPWPKASYGAFYSGDCYIVLNTVKRGNSLGWDVHFWIGNFATQDEYGTAAYKTVELDNLLGGGPVQHREVQDHETDKFLGYFQPTGGVRIMEGGIETGFNETKPTEYRPRLLMFKGKKNIRCREVALTRTSLNSGDVFILDNGLQIFQFNGRTASGTEKIAAAKILRAIIDERQGKPKATVHEEGDKDLAPFWALLGGEGPIAAAAAAGDDWEAEVANTHIHRLYRLSDASGTVSFTDNTPANGKITKNLFDSNDVFVYDTGAEVFVWVGSRASAQEKAIGLQTAQNYLKTYGRPPYIPITKIQDGKESETFLALLDK